jgi:hypothetical protein
MSRAVDIKDWKLKDMGKIPEIIWESGQDYMYLARHRKNNRIKSPAELCKYVYFLYLLGCNLMDPIAKPTDSLEVVNTPNYTYIILKEEINLETKSHIIPLLNHAEQNMWNYITDGGQLTRFSDIFKAYNSAAKPSPALLSNLIKRNFKATMIDTKGNVWENMGITPRQLRFLRFYDVLINHKVHAQIASKWFRIKKWYDFGKNVQDALEKQEDINILAQFNLLKSYPVDAAKRLQGIQY